MNYYYCLDVLWGQPIKLSQVASTSELLENQQNDLVFFKIIPSHFCRASEASKIKYEKFGPKIVIPHWKMVFWEKLLFYKDILKLTDL